MILSAFASVVPLLKQDPAYDGVLPSFECRMKGGRRVHVALRRPYAIGNLQES